MILAKRMKLVSLTTNQTLIFVSVSEVSGDPFKERQKTTLREGHANPSENASDR